MLPVAKRRSLLEDVTPLMIAADANRLEVVKALVNLGADVNAQTACGKPVLHFAYQSRHRAIAQFLLEARAIAPEFETDDDLDF